MGRTATTSRNATRASMHSRKSNRFDVALVTRVQEHAEHLRQMGDTAARMVDGGHRTSLKVEIHSNESAL
jgi:hypothetical protein